MLSRRVGILLLAGLCLAGLASAGETPAPLQPAADLDLAAHRGHVVVLDFWASWCKPCAEALPWLSGLQARYGDAGLETFAVNLDRDEDKARAMLAKLDLAPGVVVLHDPEGKLASAYDLQGMPSTFVYGRDGTLRFSHVGFLPKAAPERAAEITGLLAEEVPVDAH